MFRTVPFVVSKHTHPLVTIAPRTPAVRLGLTTAALALALALLLLFFGSVPIVVTAGSSDNRGSCSDCGGRRNSPAFGGQFEQRRQQFAAEIDGRTETASNIQQVRSADRINIDTTKMSPDQSATVVFATRLHLGHARTPPADADLRHTVSSFLAWAAQCGATRAAIAVDPAPRIAGYDLVAAVEAARDAHCAEAERQASNADESAGSTGSALICDVVPVTPWGKFVPALNALVGWAAALPGGGAGRILFASAETTLAPASVALLLGHVDDGTLVAGCALPGHDYHEETTSTTGTVPLTGRTTPWNTCAIWNVPKLATTGFPLVAEGLHWQQGGEEGTLAPGPSGVEEASAIALLQRTLPAGTAVAKLVRVPGVQWEVDWEDAERREWHERKMRSKTERAAVHLRTLGLEGTVLHV